MISFIAVKVVLQQNKNLPVYDHSMMKQPSITKDLANYLLNHNISNNVTLDLHQILP